MSGLATTRELSPIVRIYGLNSAIAESDLDGGGQDRFNGPGEKVSYYDFPILPSTKVGALLDRFPELEDILIGLAPPFKKLKNPLLRKGAASVASLKHAAVVGGLPVNDLVNKLRAVVGQEPIASQDDRTPPLSYFSCQPEWFAGARIVTSI